MSRSNKLIIVLCAFVLVACARNVIPIPSTDDPAITVTAERSALLQEVTGQVEFRSAIGLPWKETSAGITIAQGNQLRTNADSRAYVRLTEGSRIRLGPDTSFAINLLNPFMDSLLTSLALDRGQLWIMLNGGALDVELPLGLASARAAYMSVGYDSKTQNFLLTCLQGTCSFNQTFIPESYKLSMKGLNNNATPEPMTFGDYGMWGVNVPEATQIAYLATESQVQGSATVPAVNTPAPTNTPAPPTSTPTLPPPTDTAAPNKPTSTPIPTTTPLPPSATPRPLPPPATRIPPTPYPLIGHHLVQAGETVFCIARVYGVLPNAIAEANGLSAPFFVNTGQMLGIPAVPWTNISAGPVCAPQFVSPYPGLSFATATPEATVTPAGPPLVVNVGLTCLAGCDTQDGIYRLQIDVTVSGGIEPYTYDPAQSSIADFPHCTSGFGTVRVTSADGQTQTVNWNYIDTPCPTP